VLYSVLQSEARLVQASPLLTATRYITLCSKLSIIWSRKDGRYHDQKVTNDHHLFLTTRFIRSC
jgi:hypothetical protein